ncbi:MAG: M48 family metalloprotease [Syntrophales bacterium]
MKKFAIVIVLILLSGCAAKQVATPYVVPHALQVRAATVYYKVANCMAFDPEKKPRLYLSPDKMPSAFYSKDNRVILSEGLFSYDDDTISFVSAHELAHAKLDHLETREIVSGITTGVMVIVNTIVPGAGLLNWIANPMMVNGFSRPQELAADKLASQTVIRCNGIPVEKQVHIMQTLQKDTATTGGGIWSGHPSWEDRIKNIQKSP